MGPVALKVDERSVGGFLLLAGLVGLAEIAVHQTAIEVLVFLEMRMQPIDAGVDHRPDDALTQGPEGVARRICLDRGDGRLVSAWTSKSGQIL